MAILGVQGEYDAWQRECLIEVSDGTTHVQLAGLTETVDIDTGERELDVLNLLNLGQIPKHGGHGITTVTFEGYPLEVGTVGSGAQTGTGFWDIFAEIPGKDTEPQQILITNEVNRMRVVILWTDETGETLASGALTSGALGARFILSDCYCTSHKTDFTDGIMKVTLMFKGTAFENSASARMKMESIDGSAGLSALNTYVPGTTPF